MKLSCLLAIFMLLVPASAVFGACPTGNCPADRDNLVLSYDFENNTNDQSGNGLDAASDGFCTLTYTSGVGGRPGYYLNGIPYNIWCAINLPACAIFRDEGEIEWYQYITNTAAPQLSTLFFWQNSTGSYYGHIYIYGSVDPETYLGGKSVMVRYSSGPGMVETYLIDCVIEKQWQHFSFQWGSFGSRLVVDGVVKGADTALWDQGPRDYPLASIGDDFEADGQGFTGYIDDFKIWTCGSHGTPTFTPTITLTWTLTYTASPTLTNTPTISPTWTASPTATQISTPSITPTFSITQTFTALPTSSISPTFTPTFTATMTYTVSPTWTVTPVPAEFKIFGCFPNPFQDSARVVLGLPNDCAITLTVYTVSGEKANEYYFSGKTGMNAFYIMNSNFSGIKFASGIFLYRVKAVFKNRSERILWQKFAISY